MFQSCLSVISVCSEWGPHVTTYGPVHTCLLEDLQPCPPPINLFKLVHYVPHTSIDKLIERPSCLPPATKLGQGYVFTGVCDSVNGGVPHTPLPYPWEQTPPPREQTPPGPDTSQEQTPPGPDTPRGSRPPREQTPPRRADTPPRRACCEIPSTRGRYVSYRNAILLFSENSSLLDR